MKRVGHLDSEIKSFARQERELLSRLLPLLSELDVTKGYLDLGAASLFDYLTEQVGYSEGSAQRRIDAARLLKSVPDLGAKIESGAIKLNQVTLIRRSARIVSQSRKVTDDEKQTLTAALEGMNHRDSQRAVAEFFDLPIIEVTNQTVQKDESVRLELTVSKELHAKLIRAQELLSHAVPSGEIVDFLGYVVDRVIESKTPKTSKSRKSAASEGVVASKDETARAAIHGAAPWAVPRAAPARDVPGTALAATAAVPAKLRSEILHESQGCDHRDEPAGAKCGSRWQLEVDHRHPRWAGGGSERENLHALCRRHNQKKYRDEVAQRLRPT